MIQENMFLSKNLEYLQNKLMKNNAPEIFFETTIFNKIPEKKIENLLVNNSNDTRGLISNLLPQSQNKVLMYNTFSIEDNYTSEESEITIEMKDDTDGSCEIIYKCPKKGCSNIFKNVDDFNSHFISSHIEKKYSCKEINCNKIFKRFENLNSHISVVHLQKRPFKCKFCNKEFTHRSGVSYHEKKFHINLTPFKCIYPGCNISFPTSSSLIKHEVTHYPKKKKKKLCKMDYETLK